MKSGEIKDMGRRLRRLGILGIAIGLVVIGFNLMMLMLTRGFMSPWQFATRVLSVLVGTTVLSTGMLCLISARSLARPKILPEPTRFSSWFTNKRNFILIIILSFILTFIAGFLIIKAIAEWRYPEWCVDWWILST